MCLELLRAGQSVLVVCYTNHALDQFLVMLEDHGVTEMARLGERSRSPQMEKYSMSSILSVGGAPATKQSNARRARFRELSRAASNRKAKVDSFTATIKQRGAIEDAEKLAAELQRQIHALQGKLWSGRGDRQELEQMREDVTLLKMELDAVLEKVQEYRRTFSSITEETIDEVRPLPAPAFVLPDFD